MFGLSHLQTQLAACGVGAAILISVVVWLRTDAANDRELELQNQHVQDRIEHIDDSKETQNEIENLSATDLDHALCLVLSTPAQCVPGRPVQGREPEASKSTTFNY